MPPRGARGPAEAGAPRGCYDAPAMDRPQPAEDPRLHPLTRVGLYLLAFLVLNVVIGVPVVIGWVALTGADPAALAGGEVPLAPFLLVFVFLAPVMVPLTVVFLRGLDRRPLASIGARLPESGAAGAVREAGAGVLVAAGLLGLWLLAAAVPAELEFGGLSAWFRSGPRWLPGWGGGAAVLVLYLVGFAIQGALEEWVIRGYVYRALRERWSWAASAGASAAGFALLHGANPSVDPAGLVNTFLLGVALAAAVEVTGTLWAAAAAHGAWNFLMASVLALPVSGVRADGLLDLSVEGPAWATGGSYGPEGSWLLAALIVPLVVGLARRADRSAAEATEALP